MVELKKIVNCTPEQYMTLLKEGQVEVNGKIMTKEENTLYNTGELGLLEWYNKIMEDIHNRYKISHTPITTNKTLEQEYDDIITSNNEYQSASAVGFRAILKNGDTINITSYDNSGDFFINGDRVTHDYTYNGEGVELVSVWVFEYNDGDMVVPICLNDEPTFTSYEIIIKNHNQTPTVNANYYLYAERITTHAFDLTATPGASKFITANGTNNFTQKVSKVVREVSSDCEQFASTAFKSHGYIRTIKLPNCKKIDCGNTNMFAYCSVQNWEFGKLTSILCVSTTNTNYIGFYGANTIYIPKTVTLITGTICANNINITLDCANATSISNNWCHSAPTNFTMAKDWNASINISKAAGNWSKDKFVDLFENYLLDLSGVNDDGTILTEKELTIPQAIFDALTDEELNIARNKNWIVGGA